MSGEELARPHTGIVAGVPYVALPPTAADADPDGSPPLILAWHGLRPPRTETAFAAAVPMTGVPGWRIYLRLPEGPDDTSVIEQAAGQAPAVATALREILQLESAPVGLAGFSLGGGVALRTLARSELAVTAAALIAPLPIEGLRVDSVSPTNQHPPTSRVAAQHPALLLVGGGNDDTVPPSQLAALRDQLRTAGIADVELAIFRMSHSLAAQPGTEARPQIAEAISVDAAVTDWFRDHLGVRPRELSDPAPRTATQASART